MSTTVFISSTSRDLLDHRAAVATALLNAGYHPIDMANFMARSEDATTACLKEVAEADHFVGFYAWRYGYIPAGSKVSITEQEFNEAEQLAKPCFCFVVDEAYDWPVWHKELDPGAQLLRDFKSRLDAKLVRTNFTTPDDLAIKVLASLQRWERAQSRDTKSTPVQSSPSPEPSIAGISVSEVGGDVIAGDKIGGDKVLGDKFSGVTVSDSTGVSVGRQGSVTVTQEKPGDDLAKLFELIYDKIEARPNDPNVDKDEITSEVKRIEQEAAKGDAANPTKVGRWLRTLAIMAPDIFEVVVSTLANPVAGVTAVVNKIANKARAEAGQ